jgi:hypothetical protein
MQGLHHVAQKLMIYKVSLFIALIASKKLMSTAGINGGVSFFTESVTAGSNSNT